MTAHHGNAGEVAVHVRTGRSQDRVINAALHQSVMTILERIAAELDLAIDELDIYRDDHDGPLCKDDLIDIKYPHHHRHHIHHATRVQVTVFYQSDSHQKDFRRNTTIYDLLQWAIDAFRVDACLATELELVLHGQTDELPATEHLGHLAGRECELSVDLVRGVIANGGGQ